MNYHNFLKMLMALGFGLCVAGTSMAQTHPSDAAETQETEVAPAQQPKPAASAIQLMTCDEQGNECVPLIDRLESRDDLEAAIAQTAADFLKKCADTPDPLKCLGVSPGAERPIFQPSVNWNVQPVQNFGRTDASEFAAPDAFFCLPVMGPWKPGHPCCDIHPDMCQPTLPPNICDVVPDFPGCPMIDPCVLRPWLPQCGQPDICKWRPNSPGCNPFCPECGQSGNLGGNQWSLGQQMQLGRGLGNGALGYFTPDADPSDFPPQLLPYIHEAYRLGLQTGLGR